MLVTMYFEKLANNRETDFKDLTYSYFFNSGKNNLKVYPKL